MLNIFKKKIKSSSDAVENKPSKKKNNFFDMLKNMPDIPTSKNIIDRAFDKSILVNPSMKDTGMDSS